MNFRNLVLFFSVTLVLTTSSCKKYLDEKAIKTQTIATTVTDAQSLLDDFLGMNYTAPPLVAAFMDDDFYVTDTYFDGGMSTTRQLLIKWDPSAVDFDPNWKVTYQFISQANVALETLDKLKPEEKQGAAYNLARGGALFFRAFYHHLLAIPYCKAYNAASASTDLGIPYKKKSDINDPTVRLSVKDSYEAMIADLKEAVSILPVSTTTIARPSRVAAFGLLARIYLSMNDYPNALIYSDSALRLNSTLMDYNSFIPYSPTTTATPFPMGNSEDIFHAVGQGASLFGSENCITDSILYNSYDVNDLRKTLFFATTTVGPNTHCFRGSYEPFSGYPFAGIATDELFLIRAESYARQGNTSAALADLNTLMSYRWKTGTFVNFTAATASDALKIILKERRKELIQRNEIRFSDLKRLNLDPNFAITIRRTIKGVVYSLPPNDLRYQLLLPVSVVQTSGIPQNPR